ncbi:MAG: efflux RND transporter periplasmic adaptor subunit [Candidatus Acidiferrum sp.]
MAPVIADERKQPEKLADSPTNPRAPQHWPAAGKSVATVATVAAAFFAVVLVFGLAHQRTVRSELAADARDHARTPVSVTHPESSASQLGVRFPANIQAFTETPIYSRTNGYIKRWYADIGARVQRGQLLAEVETPELDQQLRQAEASQAQAQANLDLARTTAARYQELLKQDGVSKQETDQAVGTLHADEASVKAALANVNQLKELQSFEKVTAPFAGTITARYIDTGSLIASGTNTLLFRLADISTLRVYASVPEVDSKDVALGVPVELETPGTKGKKYSGRVVRTAGAIDPVSRTLLTEIHVPNPKLELVPGEFGEVTFHLSSKHSALRIPSSALLFRAQGTQVALAQADGRVRLQNIQLGRDLGDSVEVVSGLTSDDAIIENPSDSITDGTLVSVQPAKDQ